MHNPGCWWWSWSHLHTVAQTTADRWSPKDCKLLSTWVRGGWEAPTELSAKMSGHCSPTIGTAAALLHPETSWDRHWTLALPHVHPGLCRGQKVTAKCSPTMLTSPCPELWGLGALVKWSLGRAGNRELVGPEHQGRRAGSWRSTLGRWWEAGRWRTLCVETPGPQQFLYCSIKLHLQK